MLWNILHPYQCLIPIDDRDISTIFQLPLAFVRSGGVNLDASGLYDTGWRGYDWSRMSKLAAHAYYLSFSSSAVVSSNDVKRWLGFPLRDCTVVYLPLAFVRSGYAGIDTGSAGYVSVWGNNWSRSVGSRVNAYRFGFDLTNVYSSRDNSRWGGFPLQYLSITFELLCGVGIWICMLMVSIRLV